MSNLDLGSLAKAVGNDWVAGRYYDDAERDMDRQWDGVIWPLIKGSDFMATLDLAAGHGRNTAKLLQHAGRVIAVDINQSNIDVLTRRFEQRPNVTLVRNNGSDLRDIPGATITFLYSFDAMVHFDSDVVHAYVAEFRRVMRPGARGFCHYSNNTSNPTGTYRDHPGWRNFMSRALFEHWLVKQGFRIVESRYLTGVVEVIDHDDGHCDAMTLFELPDDAKPLGDFLDWSHDGANGAEITGPGSFGHGLRTEFDRLLGEITGQATEIRRLVEKVGWLENDKAGFERHAAGLEGIVHELREEMRGIAEHRDHLLGQNQHIEQRAEEHERILAELREAERTERKQRDALFAKVNVLDEQANELQAMLGDAQREGATLSERVRWMEQEWHQRAREMDSLQNDLSASRSAQETMLSSRSWRMTSSLRRLRGLFG